jgi:hypothetical protein
MGIRSDRLTSTIFTPATVVVLFLVAVIPLQAGQGPAGDQDRKPVLTVSPDPGYLPGMYEVEGSGFRPGGKVVVNLTRHCENGQSISAAIWVGLADLSGSFAFPRATESCAGSYLFTASQYSLSKRTIRATDDIDVRKGDTSEG